MVQKIQSKTNTPDESLAVAHAPSSKEINVKAENQMTGEETHPTNKKSKKKSRISKLQRQNRVVSKDEDIKKAVTTPNSKPLSSPKTVASEKKVTAPGSSPANASSFDPNNPLAMGKVIYFLDQMKQEVIEADKTTWVLQNDLKAQIARNKMLDSRIDELEKTLVEEKKAREATQINLENVKDELKLMWQKNKEYETRNVELGDMLTVETRRRELTDEELKKTQDDLHGQREKNNELEKWVSELDKDYNEERKRRVVLESELTTTQDELGEETRRNQELMKHNTELETDYNEERRLRDYIELKHKSLKKKFKEIKENQDDWFTSFTPSCGNYRFCE